ncbi:MAG: hypothetical protein RXQ62_07135 [Nitrososphaeria archaeon]
MSTKRHIKLASMLRLVVRDDYEVMHNIMHLKSWTTDLDNHFLYISRYAKMLSKIDQDLKGVQTRLDVIIDMLTKLEILRSKPITDSESEKQIAGSLAKIVDSMASIREYLRALRYEASTDMSRLKEEMHELVKMARDISEKYSAVKRRMDKIMEALGVKEEVTKS